MRFVKMLAALLLCLPLCFGCAKAAGEGQEALNAPAEETEKTAADASVSAGEDSRTDNEIIADAMEETSKLAAFQASVEGSIRLGGKTINGEFGMESQIHVVQGEDRQDPQMRMETRLNPGGVTKAYYRDGWYYLDDGKNKEKQEKSPDEVLGLVTDITDMVIDAADQIEDIRVKEDGADKVYSYALPAYIAEDYIEKLLDEMGAGDTLLDNASTEVEELRLTSTVNGDGILTRQEVAAAGKLKKAIVSVPVEAKIEADFAKTDEKELKMELW